FTAMKHSLKILAPLVWLCHFAHAEDITDPPAPVASLVEENKNVTPDVIKSTRDFRERLLADPYRPAFHFSFPEDVGMPGDLNGAFYKDGLYHLMYLYKRAGAGFA